MGVTTQPSTGLDKIASVIEFVFRAAAKIEKLCVMTDAELWRSAMLEHGAASRREAAYFLAAYADAKFQYDPLALALPENRHAYSQARDAFLENYRQTH